MFFSVIAATSYKSYLIKSTDCDILFVACVNYELLKNKLIFIQYNTVSEALKHINLSEMFVKSCFYSSRDFF